MNINEILQALTAGLQEESDAVNPNFSDPLHQMPNDIEFDEEGWSNTIILKGERPEWVHDKDVVSFDVENDTAAFAKNISEESAFWEEELAFRVFDRNHNSDYPKPSAEPAGKGESQEKTTPFIVLTDEAVHLMRTTSMDEAQKILEKHEVEYHAILSVEAAASLMYALRVAILRSQSN